ncbi:MAG: hypothetical protein V1828_00035 [Candidatus Omnitrophota bacterium]
MQKIIKKYWENGSLSFLLIAAIFICLLRLSWLKYGDLIVDVGREMYVPLQILSGKLLYRDLCYAYGPFSPYFNALLYKLFSPSLYTLFINGILTASVASLLIYKISRFFLKPFFSTLSASTFLIVFAFGQYVYLGNYNFILPYTYAATNSLCFALLAFYFFCLSVSKRFRRYQYLCCLFITLALLTKIEVGAAILLSLATASFFHSLAFKATLSSRIRALLKRLCFYVIIPLFLAGAVYAALFASITKPALRNFIFELAFLNINAGYIFTRWMSGIGDLSVNLGIILKSSLAYLALIFIFSLNFKAGRRPGRAARMLAGGFCVVLIMFFLNKYFPFDWQYRPLPIICLLVMLIGVFGLLKSGDPAQKQKSLFLLALSTFSLILASRMIFFARAAHFGFYILVPGMIVYYVFFLKLVPELLDLFNLRGCQISNPAGCKLPERGFYYSAFTTVFLFFILQHFNVSKFCYENKTLKIDTPRGRMYVFNTPAENRCKELIEYLRNNTGKEQSLAIFPEGLPINFLAERENPLHYYTYAPINLRSAEVVDDIIGEMDAKKVDYVAINQRDTAEFGYFAFGVDYAQPLWKYIKENYLLIKQFGPFPYTSQEFGIALFKRKERA